jgi:hypothetical protein
VWVQHQSFFSADHPSRQLLYPALQSKGRLTSSKSGGVVGATPAAVAVIIVAVALSPVVVEVLVVVVLDVEVEVMVVVVLDVKVVDVVQPTCSLMQHHHSCVSDQASGTCTWKMLCEPSGSHSSAATPEV